MRRIAAILGALAILLVLGGGPSKPASARARPITLRKFDEFGKIGHCDLTARLDNFAIQMQNTHGAQAYVFAYAPPGVGEALLEHIKNYLVNSRGLPEKRIKTIYGGRNSDLTQPKIQLWILPKNATPPEPEKYETNIETFKGLFVDERAHDDFGLYIEPEMGPGIGGTTDASFADMLHQQKDAVGYIVVYSGEDATPGAWRRLAQQQIDYLKKFKLEDERFKVIFGGHQKDTRIQLWILPKNSSPPVPDAGPELPPTKAVKAGDFSFELGYKQNQTIVLTRLSEILTKDKSVRAFLVVRLEAPTPDEPSEGNEPAPVQEPEPPAVTDGEPTEPIEEPEPVDLTKLVEKWRVELATTHKIDADRFIVLFTTARETEGNQISLWIVPKGAPLPDPNAEEEPVKERLLNQ